MNELVAAVHASEAAIIIEGINNASNEIFHSFPVESYEDRIKLYNATSSDGETVKDNINKILNVVDVVVMPVEIKNDDGSTGTVPRVTLITADGKMVSAASWGVYNSTKKIAAIFGGLHFDPPIKVIPVEVKTKNGFTMNLKLA